jgi:PDZ domain
MQFNQSLDKKQARGGWPVLIGAFLVIGGLTAAALQSNASKAVAQDAEKKSADDKKSIDEIQDELQKALESLKKGPEPKKEENNPADLNPIDQMHKLEEALKKAQKDLRDNPGSEEARNAVEEATKNYQNALRKNRPNLQVDPIAPINPENLDREIERFNREIQLMMQEMNRQMPMPGFGVPGFGVGGRVGLNRLPMRALGDVRLGVQLDRPTPALSDQLDLPANRGLVVAGVLPDTPAAAAGILPHDILLEIGGKPVLTDVVDLQRVLREFKVDEKVDVVLMRKGKKLTLKDVKLPAAKPEQANFLQPVIPQLLIPNAQILNPQFAPAPGVNAFGNNVRMSVQATGNEFTVKYGEDALSIVVVGTKEDGKVKPTSITVTDEKGKEIKADSLEKLDQQYREKVERILKGIR